MQEFSQDFESVVVLFCTYGFSYFTVELYFISFFVNFCLRSSCRVKCVMLGTAPGPIARDVPCGSVGDTTPPSTLKHGL